MKIRSSVLLRLLVLALIICAATVHADAGGPLRLTLDPGARVMDPSLAARQNAGHGPRVGNALGMILAGVAGNAVGMVAGIYMANLDLGGGRVGDPIVGALAGSFCGSTLGVYLAGSAGGRKGKFGSALLGSLLGEVASFVLAIAIPSEEFPFLAGFLVLPPIGAALFFNNSLASRSVRAGNGLFNLTGGKLGFGMPDVHIRPVFVPGGRNAKPEMQFNVNVLSVEL